MNLKKRGDFPKNVTIKKSLKREKASTVVLNFGYNLGPFSNPKISGRKLDRSQRSKQHHHPVAELCHTVLTKASKIIELSFDCPSALCTT